MAYRIKWLGGDPADLEINRQTQPEFYRLYQRAVLLCLQEQGVLDEAQVRWCLDRLGQRGEDSFQDQ